MANSPDIIVLKFADSKIPVFKEARGKDYIKYGDENNYPEYLTYLFNKSAKHNAIITGKTNYIFGEGYENGDVIVNRLKESLNDITKKAILDIEIYGGFRLEFVYNSFGKIAEIYHVDYSCIRVGKDGGYYYKETWKTENREPEEFIPAFNPNKPEGSQIYAYNEYRPMTRFYPLPSYIGCNNYIETDIEISKFYLSGIRNGMSPSKMIQFFQGEPTEEEKRELERRFKSKFTGSETAGNIILAFNTTKDKSIQIDDLSGSDLDKQFIELNKVCQQEIFSGHNITSPMLFGIKTEGQLGGSTELAIAYSIFQNTYSKPKATAFDKEVNYVLSFSVFAGAYELRPTDPIGIQFDVKDVVNSLPKQFVFEKLGIPKEQWGLENIGADNRPTPTTPIAPSTDISAPSAMANDNIKNLSAKQHQQLMRIIRQYGKGQLTELAAKALLRTGLGLNDEDINSLLGISPAAMSFEQQEDSIIGMFDACGEIKNDFQIVKTKAVSFSSDLEMEQDEAVFIKEAFREYDVTYTEDRILELIKKDPKITAEVIGQVIGQSKTFVEGKISNLIKRGYLEESIETIGEDIITNRIVPKELNIKIPPIGDKTPPSQIMVMYSYEVKPGIGPSIIPTTRPFCRRMVGLNRFYSRADIENLSQRLGYSVFDRKGGWWGHNPECRHRWQSNITVRKKVSK